MAGLMFPAEGQIIYGGIPGMAAQGNFSAKQAKPFIGYFPQEPSLYPDLSCQEHLRFFAELYDMKEVLLLDEPTIGVDPVSRRELWDIVYKSAAGNMTVILSTSYIDEAERCGKVHVLDEGRLIASGTPQEAKRQSGTEKFEDIFLIPPTPAEHPLTRKRSAPRSADIAPSDGGNEHSKNI